MFSGAVRRTPGLGRLASHASGRVVLTSRRPLGQRASSSSSLLTLAIETSCDDTCVAILEKGGHHGRAALHFNKNITSDNRAFGGVHPLVATVSHAANLANLVQESLQFLPEASVTGHGQTATVSVRLPDGSSSLRRKPDFVSVTRGPGQGSSLATGLETAKGLAVAWQVPLVGAHHMQAHALTPRLVAALEGDNSSSTGEPHPAFPFLSLLVSGGHTILVHSRSLTEHRILAQPRTIALGDMLDKCARDLLPPALLAANADVMYGRLLEAFAFPAADGSSATSPSVYEYTPPARRADEIAAFDSGHGWTLRPPLAGTRRMEYDFTGLGSQVRAAAAASPDMAEAERRLLARATMRLAFEHLASRVLLALQADGDSGDMADVRTLVVAGGVASNRFLRHVLSSVLDVRGFGHVQLVAPPPRLCTDNAAMIAWAAMEMFEAGWETALSATVQRTWPLDPRGGEGCGVLGLDGWVRRP